MGGMKRCETGGKGGDEGEILGEDLATDLRESWRVGECSTDIRSSSTGSPEPC